MALVSAFLIAQMRILGKGLQDSACDSHFYLGSADYRTKHTPPHLQNRKDLIGFLHLELVDFESINKKTVYFRCT